MVITRDPDSDWVNAGTYRCQVQDEKTVNIFIEPGKHGDIIRRKYWACLLYTSPSPRDS